jgi:hypothetical protein
MRTTISRRGATGAALIVGLLSIAAAASAATPSAAVLVPFEGPWVLEGAPKPLRTVDSKEPPLRAAAKKTYLKNQALRQQGDTGFDPITKCLPAGIPRLYTQPGTFRLAIGDRFAGMFFENHHLFRVITMYRGHFEAIGPGYEGQAAGHWEGNTLVLDTNQFNDVTLLDDAGMPHSEDLHVVERLSVAADGKLHIALSIRDPKTFTQPFRSELVFDPQPGKLPSEDYCLQRTGLIDQN